MNDASNFDIRDSYIHTNLFGADSCRATIMQTFLPYPDFTESLNCLDNRRLGKQRVEAMQILNILLDRTTSNAWKNHPAVKMWKCYGGALQLYHNLCLDVWTGRGFRNNMLKEVITYPILYPYWLGDERLHASHRSNLLRKDPIFYGRYRWTEPNNLPYYWPEGR